MTLEIHTDIPINHFVHLKRAEPIIKDSTMMQLAKLCMRKYFYRFVIGYVKKGNDDSPWFPWGSAYHKLRELLEIEYNKQIEAGASFEDAKINASVEASSLALELYRKTRIKNPLPKYEAMYTEDRFLAAVKVTLKHWAKEKDMGTIKVLDVEQPFMVQLPDGHFTGGRFDQIIKWNGKIWGRDFKTTGKKKEYYSATLEPNDQFTRYTVAESLLKGEKITGQLVEVLFNDGRKVLEILQFPVEKNQYQLDTWLREQTFWNWILDKARNEDNYPMADNTNHCSFCEYRIVCNGASESSIEHLLKTKYDVSFWDYTTVKD